MSWALEGCPGDRSNDHPPTQRLLHYKVIRLLLHLLIEEAGCKIAADRPTCLLHSANTASDPKIMASSTIFIYCILFQYCRRSRPMLYHCSFLWSMLAAVSSPGKFMNTPNPYWHLIGQVLEAIARNSALKACMKTVFHFKSVSASMCCRRIIRDPPAWDSFQMLLGHRLTTWRWSLGERKPWWCLLQSCQLQSSCTQGDPEAAFSVVLTLLQVRWCYCSAQTAATGMMQVEMATHMDASTSSRNSWFPTIPAQNGQLARGIGHLESQYKNVML